MEIVIDDFERSVYFVQTFLKPLSNIRDYFSFFFTFKYLIAKHLASLIALFLLKESGSALVRIIIILQ